jgi:hypothetical protein
MSMQTITRTHEETQEAVTSEPFRTTTDPQDVVRSLYSSLGHSFVPGGPGGPGGTGPPAGPGPARPNDPGAPPNFGPGHQVPVPDAQDVKMMGVLPEKFTGDCTQAQNFLDTIKGYIHLNQDVAGFNLPKKKVAFVLTLLEGPEVAGWKQDISKWIDELEANKNIPAVWTLFLHEFS